MRGGRIFKRRGASQAPPDAEFEAGFAARGAGGDGTADAAGQMSRLQFVRPTQAEVQNQPIADEPDHGANGTATLGSPETVESFERRFADAETRFADVQTKLDRRAEELATQLAEAIRREQEACERAERAEENLEAERMRREREQKNFAPRRAGGSRSSRLH